MILKIYRSQIEQKRIPNTDYFPDFSFSRYFACSCANLPEKSENLFLSQDFLVSADREKSVLRR